MEASSYTNADMLAAFCGDHLSASYRSRCGATPAQPAEITSCRLTPRWSGPLARIRSPRPLSVTVGQTRRVRHGYDDW